MGFKDFFKKREENAEAANRTEWGGTELLPAFGKMPGYPGLPKAHIPANLPRVEEPSPESIMAANKVIDSSLSDIDKGK